MTYLFSRLDTVYLVSVGQTGRQAGAIETANPCSFVGPGVLMKLMLLFILCMLVPCSAGVVVLLLTTTNTVQPSVTLPAPETRVKHAEEQTP